MTEQLDSAIIAKILAEESQRSGAKRSPAMVDSGRGIQAQFEMVESELQAHCSVSLGAEAERNVHVIFHPASGISISEAGMARRWSEVPEPMLARCVPGLKQLPKQMAKHMKRYESQKLKGHAGSIVAAARVEEDIEVVTKPPAHLEGKMPRSLDKGHGREYIKPGSGENEA